VLSCRFKKKELASSNTHIKKRYNNQLP